MTVHRDPRAWKQAVFLAAGGIVFAVMLAPLLLPWRSSLPRCFAVLTFGAIVAAALVAAGRSLWTWLFARATLTPAGIELTDWRRCVAQIGWESIASVSEEVGRGARSLSVEVAHEGARYETVLVAVQYARQEGLPEFRRQAVERLSFVEAGEATVEPATGVERRVWQRPVDERDRIGRDSEMRDIPRYPNAGGRVAGLALAAAALIILATIMLSPAGPGRLVGGVIVALCLVTVVASVRGMWIAWAGSRHARMSITPSGIDLVDWRGRETHIARDSISAVWQAIGENARDLAIEVPDEGGRSRIMNIARRERDDEQLVNVRDRLVSMLSLTEVEAPVRFLTVTKKRVWRRT